MNIVYQMQQTSSRFQTISREKKLKSEADRERFDFSRPEKISREKVQLEKFYKKIYQRKKLKLRSLQSTVDNKSYVHKEKTFLITSRQKIDEKYFYFLKSSRTEKNLSIDFKGKKFTLFQTILIKFYIDFSKNLRFWART